MKKIIAYVESNYIKYFHGRCNYRYRITILIPNINGIATMKRIVSYIKLNIVILCYINIFVNHKCAITVHLNDCW